MTWMIAFQCRPPAANPLPPREQRTRRDENIELTQAAFGDSERGLFFEPTPLAKRPSISHHQHDATGLSGLDDRQ